MCCTLARRPANVATMQTVSTPAHRLTLNRWKLTELRDANGIRSDRALARHLGVNTSTLVRVSEGYTTPSNQFMAAVKATFPLCSLDDLFTLESTR